MTSDLKSCVSQKIKYEIQSLKQNSLHYCVDRHCMGLEILSPSFDIWSTQLFSFLPFTSIGGLLTGDTLSYLEKFCMPGSSAPHERGQFLTQFIQKFSPLSCIS